MLRELKTNKIFINKFWYLINLHRYIIKILYKVLNMSYNLTKDNLDSDELSNDYFNQDDLFPNGLSHKSIQKFLPDSYIPNLNEIQNIFSFKKEGNNIDQSLINNNNKSNYIIDDKKEIFQIVNKEIQIQIIANKKNNSKEKEISNKEKKKQLFKIIDIDINDKIRSKRDNKGNSLGVSKSEKDKTRIKHSKFSDDNLRIKCKYIVLSHIKDFINEKIAQIYKYNLGDGIKVKKLMNLNKRQIANAKIKDNKAFMKKTLAEIFSDSISGRYTNLPKDKNKMLIKELMNEKDEAKRIYFQKWFNLNFIECVKHFSNKKPVEILKGLMTFEKMKSNPVELNKKCITIGTDNYLEKLDYYFKNYENILSSKFSRNKEKKKEQENSSN